MTEAPRPGPRPGPLSAPRSPQDVPTDAPTGPDPDGEGTGDARVDRALAGVADLEDLPVDEHADRLGAAHTALQEVLRQPADG